MKQISSLMQIGLKTILFLLTISFALTSCYTDYGLASSEYDVIITQYNKTSDFSNYKTFAIVDSVYHLTGDTSQPDSEYLTRVHDDFIINTIIKNMKNLGYTEVINPQDTSEVDVVLYVAAQGTKVDQYYYGGWWGGYYPGWGWSYPGWGWGYPGYVGSTTYYVGTLFINYVDVSNIGNTTVDVEWHAILNGLLNNDTYTVTQNRLEERIDKAFTQSPYLQVSN
jgi:hypothetical protein